MSNGTVRFKCPFCGQVSEGSAQYAGTEENCPSCGRRFRLKAVENEPSLVPNAFSCYLGMLKRYVGFRGRTSRREFWWAMLFNTVITFVMAFVGGVVSGVDEDRGNEIVGVYVLATLLPFLAIHVRRLHDTNKSGWWVLLLPMPILNIAYLVWLATCGDKGENRFGKDTKNGK